MTTDLVTNGAVEAAARAWQAEAMQAQGKPFSPQRVIEVVLTAAAPLIAAQALDGHRCDEQAERAYRRAVQAAAEDRDLRAGIETLLEEWRSTPMSPSDARTVAICADALDALLPERAR